MSTQSTLKPDLGPDFARIRTGEVPAVAAGLLLIWQRLLSDAAAYARLENPNLFHQVQTIYKLRPEWRTKFGGDTLFGRFGQETTEALHALINLFHDGTNWQLDDVTAPGWMAIWSLVGDSFSLQRAPAGGVPAVPVPVLVVSATGQIFERGRGVALGEFVTPGHSDATYQGDGVDANWVVAGGNVLSFGYALAGRALTIPFVIANSNVAGAPTQLQITIPLALAAVRRIDTVGYAINNGGAREATVVYCAAAGTTINVERLSGVAWTNTGGANNTAVAGEITIEI